MACGRTIPMSDAETMAASVRPRRASTRSSGRSCSPMQPSRSR